MKRFAFVVFAAAMAAVFGPGAAWQAIGSHGDARLHAAAAPQGTLTQSDVRRQRQP
jgi:hypothetical protein